MDWNKIPSLSALRAFEAAARCRNFSKAARELNVTPAAVAHHVRSLEADFSENLVVRQGRGIAVTPSGKILADYLQNGFGVIAEGVNHLRSQSEDRPLNITVTPAFAAHWLMPRIGDFWAKHPDVSININPGTNLVDLRKDGFDMAIRYGDGSWPHVVSELLTDGDFWVVSHPDLIADRNVRCLHDVIDLPWIMEGKMLERRSIVEREGIDFETVDLTLLSTNGLVLSAVASGLGVSVQPKSLVERQVEAGELAKICEVRQQGLGYYIVVRPDRHPRGLIAFQKWLRSYAS